MISCESNSQKPITFNSRSISKEEFFITITYTYNKDQWTKTISGLFIETCDFIKIFEIHVTENRSIEKLNKRKINGREAKKTS